MNSRENQVFNLLLIEYIFSKKTRKQKTNKKERKVKPWLKNGMYTSSFNIFAKLMVNDKEEFCRYFHTYSEKKTANLPFDFLNAIRKTTLCLLFTVV